MFAAAFRVVLGRAVAAVGVAAGGQASGVFAPLSSGLGDVGRFRADLVAGSHVRMAGVGSPSVVAWCGAGVTTGRLAVVGSHGGWRRTQCPVMAVAVSVAGGRLRVE